MLQNCRLYRVGWKRLTKRDYKAIKWIWNHTRLHDVVYRTKKTKWRWDVHRVDEKTADDHRLLLDWRPRHIKRPQRLPSVTRLSDDLAECQITVGTENTWSGEKILEDDWRAVSSAVGRQLMLLMLRVQLKTNQGKHLLGNPKHPWPQ